MKIKVAACQINCIDGDRKGNFERIEKVLQQLKNVNIACFPECSLLGWVNPKAHLLANPIPGADTDRLIQLAKKYQIMISIGLSEKKDIYLFDSAVLIDYTGEILLKHRKINLLTTLMDPPYTPGDKVSVITTRFGRIGMLICADTFKNKILRQIRQKKPDVLIIPYGWAEKQENWPEHGKLLKQLVKDVAKKVKAFVIGTDLIGEISSGPWNGRIYGGQSVIADKKGRILAIGKDREPDILIKEITLETNYF
ncbi:MAG: carbon-nitrogen hydrolase family protein [Candidatus Thorarchaeota archaeon]